ncbi:LytTR family transcriptional regulator DNA-binding domain-containing protein [Cohnella sp.]|uniref:LytTR family transcriptional regulator DNA-binding domain-containing protein n=1 Tax=Cohnella sp. TaxID=1883426 RepID=UPI003561EBC5
MALLKLVRIPLPAEGAATVQVDLEVGYGQCIALQCNDDQGRALVEAITGAASGARDFVLFRGKPLRMRDEDTCKRIGVCGLEDGEYPRLKVKAYLEFWAGLFGVRQPLAELLRTAGLLALADTPIARLNTSERRRLHLVRCALHDPELIVLENPEQGLDLESCAIVRRMAANWSAAGKALLITCSSTESAVSLTGDAYRLTSQGVTRLAIREEAEPVEPYAQRASDAQSDKMAKAALHGEAQEDKPRPRVAKIPAKAGDKIILVDPEEILYVESSDGQSMLHLETETLACVWTLNELELRLEPFHFYRCHRSYLVNLQQVREVIVWTRNSYSLVMADRSKRAVPLSKGRYEELKRMIGI